MKRGVKDKIFFEITVSLSVVYTQSTARSAEVIPRSRFGTPVDWKIQSGDMVCHLHFELGIYIVGVSYFSPLCLPVSIASAVEQATESNVRAHTV